MSRPYLSVIIPAWNEASRLPLTLIDVDRHLAAQDFTSEIILVISPSVDNTLDIARRFQSIIKNLQIIPLIENRGRGFAVTEGLRAAKGSYRLMMDADNSTSIIEFAKMLPYLTSETDRYDITIGSRFLAGSQTNPRAPIGLRIAVRLGKTLANTFLTKSCSDPSARFKAFSASGCERVLHHVTMNGWGIDTEIIALAERLGLRRKEVPISWAYDPRTQHGRVRGEILDYLRLSWKLLKFKRVGNE